jgi:hypothetical protein
MRRTRLLPRFVTSLALSACGQMMPGSDAGVDSGCRLPADFPPDASQAEIDNVCECHESSFVQFHCYVEGGPRCDSWLCLPSKGADGGYAYESDGGVACFC